MELCLKWVHAARYERVLKLDGALWLRIIAGPLLTPKTAHTNQTITKQIQQSQKSHQQPNK